MQSPSKKAVFVVAAVAVIAVIACFGVYSADSSLAFREQTPLEAEYREWLMNHNKRFGTTESKIRFNIWKINRATVIAHNNKNSQYKLSVNQFADLTKSEFAAIYLGAKKESATENCPPPNSTVTEFQPSIDWRNEAAIVGPVKNQGQCGSCWAFSTIASLEALHGKVTGKYISLSEQQLVDCSGNYGNFGCGGGWVQNALHYVIANGGIGKESDYPYTAADGNCQKVESAFSVTGCVNVVNTVGGITASLQVGPVPVYVEADQDAFQLYSSGVVDDASCFSYGRIDHAVIAVGYTDNAWIVRNSWGANWGDQGYIYIAKETNTNSEGICGILRDAAALPLL